jgi:hypothetical protein
MFFGKFSTRKFWPLVAAAGFVVTLLFAGCSNPAGPGQQQQAPAVPAITTAVPGNGQITIHWTPVSNATGYDVYYSLTNTPPSASTPASTENITITGTSATVTGLTNTTNGADNLCYFWVRAKNGGGVSRYSEVAAKFALDTSSLPSVSVPLTGYFRGANASFTDGFEISGSSGSYTFTYYDDADKTTGYKGNIVFIDTGNKIIYMKITNVGGYWSQTNNSYYAVAYDGVTTFGAKQSSAYGSNSDGMPTLAEAIEEYSQTPLTSNYFGYYGEYGKAPNSFSVSGGSGPVINASWAAISEATSYDVCPVDASMSVTPIAVINSVNNFVTVNTTSATLDYDTEIFNGLWDFEEPTNVWLRVSVPSVGPWIFIGTGTGT